MGDIVATLDVDTKAGRWMDTVGYLHSPTVRENHEQVPPGASGSIGCPYTDAEEQIPEAAHVSWKRRLPRKSESTAHNGRLGRMITDVRNEGS